MGGDGVRYARRALGLPPKLAEIFDGRESFPDIGQIDTLTRRTLERAIRYGLVVKERRLWPGPLVGICIKTWYRRLPTKLPGERPD